LIDLSGIWVPICTPFTENEVDVGKLEQNLKTLSQTGLRGYLALGSNGEGYVLDEKERELVVNTILRGKRKDQLVSIVCRHDSPKITLSLIKQAADLGADIVTTLPPSYSAKRMTDDVLIKYFETIANNSSLPLTLYNAPQFAGGVTISVKVVAHLSQNPNIIGIKDSAPTGPGVFLAYVKEGFQVLAGSVEFLLPSLSMGGVGGIVSSANYLPEPSCQVYELFKRGDLEEAKRLQHALVRLNRVVSNMYGVAGVKAAMDMVGLSGGDPRPPLQPLSSDDRKSIYLALEKFGSEYKLSLIRLGFR
jgi:4-hydroxy-2-oxoglutarate aldolase